MRISGGGRKRRKLRAPDTTATRPILDRVKQPLFDALACHLGVLPGAIPPFRVLDLYCGGGTLGIEALSRGAATCTFIDRGTKALATLRENLAALGLEAQSTILAGDVCTQLKLLSTPRLRRFDQRDEHQPGNGGVFDLVFLDPPFPESAAIAPGSAVHNVFNLLAASLIVADAGLVVWRFEADEELTQRIPVGWRVITLRRYGRNALAWCTPAPTHDPTG